MNAYVISKQEHQDAFDLYFVGFLFILLHTISSQVCFTSKPFCSALLTSTLLKEHYSSTNFLQQIKHRINLILNFPHAHREPH